MGRQSTADKIRTHTTFTQTRSDTKTCEEITGLLTSIADYHPSAFPITSCISKPGSRKCYVGASQVTGSTALLYGHMESSNCLRPLSLEHLGIPATAMQLWASLLLQCECYCTASLLLQCKCIPATANATALHPCYCTASLLLHCIVANVMNAVLQMLLF